MQLILLFLILLSPFLLFVIILTSTLFTAVAVSLSLASTHIGVPAVCQHHFIMLISILCSYYAP